MKNNQYLRLVYFLIYLIGLIYLFLPTPKVPDLSQSLRSTEPGDTWQNPDQKAFYTQKTRSTVISEIQPQFSLNFFGKKIDGFRLNFPPEEAQRLVRDQTVSTYLEEIVHPLRESLFVNGNEPENAPRYSHLDPSMRPRLEVNKQYYFSKITLRPVYSSIPARVIIWSLIFPLSYLVWKSIKHSIYA